jgi:hypothetical protein
LKQIASSFSEKYPIINDNALAYQMIQMASDLQIQNELKKIEVEFSMMESDGLERI